jgi:hypothetical protein
MDNSSHPSAPRPQSVTVESKYDSLNIVYRWWSFKYLFLVVFCIAWDSFLVFWYSMVSQGAPWIMILFPIGHVAVGVGLTYYTIAGFMNRTFIKINQQWITVTHGPLPWIGNKRIDRIQIGQLYAEEIRSQTSRGGTSYQYLLNIILRDNTKLKLLAGLPSPDVALFIEQTIEEYLCIEDKPVIGEISKMGR